MSTIKYSRKRIETLVVSNEVEKKSWIESFSKIYHSNPFYE